jgi:hypothetical protein
VSTHFTYVIERYGAGGEEEQLLHRAELVCAGDGFVCRVDGQDRIFEAHDVPAAIASDPMLCEVHANEITRITATGEAYDYLPLVLAVPGDPDDFDEDEWSETLADEHTQEESRVLYVNDERWGCWRTADGPRLLPRDRDWPMVGLVEVWAEMSFSELLSMTSGLDKVSIGLTTPGVIAACFLPDVTAWEAEIPAALWTRGDTSADAEVFTDWLLGWAPDGWSGGDPNFSAMMAQLFVESTGYGSDIPTSGAMLCAGNTAPGFMDGDSAQWELSVGLDQATTELVLDSIARRGGQFAEIVTAAREPESPQGKARRAALEQWEQERDQGAFALIAREAGYEV